MAINGGLEEEVRDYKRRDGNGRIVFRQLLNATDRVRHNTAMNDPQPFDIRRRIRELLAIPDRDRTDAEWDELNELEIRTAPGNRDNGYSTDRPDGKRQGGFGQNRRQGHGKKNAGPRMDARPQPVPQENRGDGPRPEGQNRPKRQHRRPKRPQQQGAGSPDFVAPQPQGNSGGGGSEDNS